MSEQRRIAAILDKADAIRRLRRESVRVAEELLRSTFLEMFGDPVTNPKGWQVHSLSSILSQPLRNGISPSKSGTYEGRVLTLSAITGSGFKLSASKIAMFDAPISLHDTLDRQDFLICRGNGNKNLVGCAVFSDAQSTEIAFPDTVIAARVRKELISKRYLEFLWRTAYIRSQIESSARTTNGTFKINQTAVEQILVPIPPLALQEKFAAIAESIIRTTAYLAEPTPVALFDSLVHRAFCGELTAPESAPRQLSIFSAGSKHS